jgi:HD-GYP domain-containing protein (c-di-GMP phosphodiesterase class II)
VTAVSPAAARPLDDDAIIELSREVSSGHLVRRHAVVGLALLFVGVAVAGLALPTHRPLSLVALVTCVGCYALASRVGFEYGGVFAIPTEAVFVVMWFVLPPRMLPLVVCAALLLAQLPDALRRRVPLDRLALVFASSWFAVGPAAVIFLWGSGRPEWRLTPVYLGALAAQLACDFVSVYIATRSVFGGSLRMHARSLLPVYAVDAMLAPLGLLVAFPASSHVWSLLLVLPVLLLFATFAKERQQRIDNALELSSAYRGTAMLLGDVIEADDEYTGSHSRDVVDLAVSVADRLGLEPDARRRTEFAALLHDVGKVKVPTEIINKAGPLDDAEWEIMKTHTILGEQMLEQIGGLLGEVGRIVRSCHERWDGGGYPDSLAGGAIPLEARIVCACDAWSAMTTDRSYRKARSDGEAAEEMRRCAGTHFDPQVVEALCIVLAV